MAAVVREMMERYPVAGLHLDYIRFSEQPSCYCSNCHRTFATSIGEHVASWPQSVISGPFSARYRYWRVQVINQWVQELSGIARAARPGSVVSAAVFSDLQRAKEEKSQDWKRWLERGSVDYVCPMNYTPDQQEFASLIEKQLQWASKDQLVVGIGSWKLDQMAELIGQIHLAGHTDKTDYLFDSHIGSVPDPVWELYRRVIERVGPVPTLAEWDDEIPGFDVVVAESRRAARIEREVMRGPSGPSASAATAGE